jgi:hypothetical protein
MAKIADSEGRSDPNSGYVRLFGNIRLGLLFSRVHATVIRSGNELEDILEDSTPGEYLATLDEIAEGQSSLIGDPVHRVIFKPKIPGSQGDIVIVDHEQQAAQVIELKNGDTFDTKKAEGELASMSGLARWIEEKTNYSTTIHFCAFNQQDKGEIIAGAKGRFSEEQVMTGHELCELLNIDYDAIRAYRQEDAPVNLDYFLRELVDIPEVRAKVEQLLQEGC